MVSSSEASGAYPDPPVVSSASIFTSPGVSNEVNTVVLIFSSLKLRVVLAKVPLVVLAGKIDKVTVPVTSTNSMEY